MTSLCVPLCGEILTLGGCFRALGGRLPALGGGPVRLRFGDRCKDRDWGESVLAWGLPSLFLGLHVCLVPYRHHLLRPPGVQFRDLGSGFQECIHYAVGTILFAAPQCEAHMLRVTELQHCADIWQHTAVRYSTATPNKNIRLPASGNNSTVHTLAGMTCLPKGEGGRGQSPHSRLTIHIMQKPKHNQRTQQAGERWGKEGRERGGGGGGTQCSRSCSRPCRA